MKRVVGKIHSQQSFGAADGPGIRYLVFMQGCPLRCSCCHNPDTWDISGGTEKTANEIFTDLKRYTDYFGSQGGITVTGGEPLLQAEFVMELFKLCKQAKINTCLDTSGCILNANVQDLLRYTDYVLLDFKYTNEQDYLKYVGCSINPVVEFLEYLSEKKIVTRLRQVIIEGINDNKENIEKLTEIAKSHINVVDVELLPFRKLCLEKYEKMGISFPFKNIPETTQSIIHKILQWRSL